jgi:hypothetical protein
METMETTRNDKLVILIIPAGTAEDPCMLWRARTICTPNEYVHIYTLGTLDRSQKS